MQEPPPEEYDQMLAFYYKWQEKDQVCSLRCQCLCRLSATDNWMVSGTSDA